MHNVDYLSDYMYTHPKYDLLYSVYSVSFDIDAKMMK